MGCATTIGRANGQRVDLRVQIYRVDSNPEAFLGRIQRKIQDSATADSTLEEYPHAVPLQLNYVNVRLLSYRL